jgi:hypothetical protein
MVLHYPSNVIGDLIFSLLVLKLREYVKVAEIAMVQVLGLVEDERTFNNLAFMKSKLGNIITTHLNLCVRMFTQNFYNVSNFHMMQPLQNGKKSALDTMQIVRFFSFQPLLASCKLRVQRLLWKYLYMFFQKSKYDSCMRFVDVGESCNSRHEDYPVSKLCGCWVGCLKVGIFLLNVYVGAKLLYYMRRTFQGQGSIPLYEMFMCLYF